MMTLTGKVENPCPCETSSLMWETDFNLTKGMSPVKIKSSLRQVILRTPCFPENR